MKENKELEFGILSFLEKNDTYNTGILESDFVAKFRHSPYYPAIDGNVFVNSIVLAHCKLLKQRGFIEFGNSANAGGNVVGPVLPDGYDFLESR